MEQKILSIQIELNPPFDPRSIRWAREAITLLAKDWEFSETACRELKLCFGEAIQNSIDHGCCGNKPINVSCSISDKRIKLTIDEPGADSDNLVSLKEAFEKEESDVPNCRDERGRGIFLIRSLMDEAKLECIDGGGVRITLIKNKS